MSFPAWLEDEGAFICAATGNLISWSSFLSRVSVHSLTRLPALGLQGETQRTEGGMWTVGISKGTGMGGSRDKGGKLAL